MNVSCCIKNTRLISHYNSHYHNNYEIAFCTKGRSTIIADGKEYKLNENDIIILPPGTTHEGGSDILFSDFFIHASSVGIDDVYVVHDQKGHILSLMEMMHVIMLEKEKNYATIVDGLFSSICNYLTNYIDVKYKFNFVSDLKNIINENFTDPFFNIASVIKRTGYNKDYLRRCFEYDVGKTPHEYLNFLRINYAKQLLVQDNFTSIKNVSDSCGFVDNLYFSTFFRKKVGMSPKQYRILKTTQ